ncbi:MAG: AAA-like domain-containing protein [Spirochaetes bacterium]|jgi:DNA polymerase III delta prime subunit|nr:AAA-like domain-containing protein [Spirochaetota bacterium]
MEKFFNTAGPVNQPEHYRVDPLHRWDLDEVLMLIAQRKYFILHAPRQTGKTSSLLALRDYLNNENDYVCVYANFEAAQAARNNVNSGLQAIVTELSGRFSSHFERDSLSEELYSIFNSAKAESGLNAVLTYLSRELQKPVVLLIDEIDSLIGDTLLSVLRQIRGGYDKRPSEFPSTIVLCGVRDIRDYRIHRPDSEIITGGSAFNIKAKSLRLGNFTHEDISALYNEHTKSTGQIFQHECFELIWRYTAGQPWLVNALAYEVTFEMKENRDRSIAITCSMIEEAKERLILSRQTHLDQLADKLEEPRVRRVVLPMILGEDTEVNKDDEQYCLDLGLISKSSTGYDISNEIYREVIPRELTDSK